MKILITGFTPFGGESVNPAYEAVKLVPDTVNGVEVIKVEVPTVFRKCGEVLKAAIEEHKPDAVVCVGQSGGRSMISIEKVAINLMEASIPDNEGNQPMEEAIYEDGKIAYFTNLPVKAIVANIKSLGIPSNISYTAGTYVCNNIMYELLYFIEKYFPGLKGGFVHVPYDIAQVVSKPMGTCYMPVPFIAKALESVITTISECDKDINSLEGTIQ